jgi:hypothetical protein
MTGFVNQALAPFTLKGFYLVTWGTALGTNVFHTVVSREERGESRVGGERGGEGRAERREATRRGSG